ncbi:hypothetical protein CJ178_31035 [Rhodococcus sp. ACPA4]|nr:hypothetical protein CJ178_31035 [Rhodococcus sp. ACPA4]
MTGDGVDTLAGVLGDLGKKCDTFVGACFQLRHLMLEPARRRGSDKPLLGFGIVFVGGNHGGLFQRQTGSLVQQIPARPTILR